MSDPTSLDTAYIVDLTLDRESSVPLYRQISVPIAEMITSGAIVEGQLLEDELSLAQRLEVSRPTARHALQQLVQEGLIVRRRGAGTRVAPRYVDRSLALTSLNDDLSKSGHVARTDVLSYEVILTDDELSDLMGVEPGTEAVSIRRLRYSDDTPLAIMHNILPSVVAPGLRALNERGLYACLEESGVQLTSALQTMGAKNASAEEAEILGLDPGAAVVTMKRISYDASNTVVEYGEHIYDATRYHLTVPLVRQ